MKIQNLAPELWCTYKILRKEIILKFIYTVKRKYMMDPLP